MTCVLFLYLLFVCLFQEKKSKGLFIHLTKTHGTVICVSTGVVLLLFIVSILVQVKQPRKKVIQKSDISHHTVSHQCVVVKGAGEEEHVPKG